MKDSRKKAVWMFIPILILCFVVSVSAQDIFRALGHERLVKELNLSPEQKETLKKIRLESMEKKIDIEAQLKKGRLLFDQEMQNEEVNKEKVMELIEETGRAQTEMKKISVTQLIEAKKILTPEQREKAKELIAKWKTHQARQKSREGIRKPRRPDKPGQGQKIRFERQRFAPQRPATDRNRPRNRGERSDLFGLR